MLLCVCVCTYACLTLLLQAAKRQLESENATLESENAMLTSQAASLNQQVSALLSDLRERERTVIFSPPHAA